MKVAIIAWGSLCWDPRDLSISSENWLVDGPELPVEFARISNDGRLTLVIKLGWDKVTTLYAISSFDTLTDAINNLRIREGTTETNIGYYNFLTSEYRIGRAGNEITKNLLHWKATHNTASSNPSPSKSANMGEIPALLNSDGSNNDFEELANV